MLMSVPMLLYVLLFNYYPMWGWRYAFQNLDLNTLKTMEAPILAAIREKYGDRLKMWGPLPKALSGAMGDYMYVANLDTKEDLEMYYSDLMA